MLKQRSTPSPDIARLGGTIESRQDDQLVITIPSGALAGLKSDPAVRYLQRVGGSPADDDSLLIGAPSDPQPGPSPATHAARFTPHALGTISWDSGNYAYDGAGNIVSIGTDNYLYDGVQRLKQSSTQGAVETYTYDGFGNMKTKTGMTIPDIQPSTNRYAGYAYNELGAVRLDGSYEFTYDALGQPLSKVYNNDITTTEYYIYTPNDERIGVERNGWWFWSVRDESGKVLRQYKSSATTTSAPALWLEDFVWRDGLLLGSERPVEMGGRRHFHLDHLGTPRLITSDSGQMVSRHDYYPFGDEKSQIWQEVAGGFDREDPMKFTSHERDYAGGMGGEDGHAVDYMHARYYSPTVGRFLSPDPLLGNLRAPQSWNRYSYVLNNPMQYVDLLGLAPVLVHDANGFRFSADEDDDGVADEKQPTSTPAQPSGTRTPAQGQAPGTQTFPNKDGGETVRTFGPDGRAVTDTDYGHGHDGAPDPHVHDWDWGNKKDPRGKARAPKPGEIPEPSKSSSVGPRRPDATTIITGLVLATVGAAVIVMTGGGMTLRPSAAGVFLVPRTIVLRPANSQDRDCPYCT